MSEQKKTFPNGAEVVFNPNHKSKLRGATTNVYLYDSAPIADDVKLNIQSAFDPKMLERMQLVHDWNLDTNEIRSEEKMKQFFKPDDFSKARTNFDCASIANLILDDEIKKAPVLVQLEPEKTFGWFEADGFTPKYFKRKARLMFIEEIQREPCKHEPVQTNAHVILTSIPPKQPKPEFKCGICGVELVATWSEKK